MPEIYFKDVYKKRNNLTLLEQVAEEYRAIVRQAQALRILESEIDTKYFPKYTPFPEEFIDKRKRAGSGLKGEVFTLMDVSGGAINYSRWSLQVRAKVYVYASHWRREHRLRSGKGVNK